MRLIDADAVLKELKKSCEYHAENSRELSLLQRDIIIVQEQPTIDAVPVIRCKDCRFRNQFGFCHRWLWVSAPKMEDDEYCSGAERKEE